MPGIEEYEPIVGKSIIDELRYLASKLEGRSVQNVNSTAAGGGVAEILSRIIPLLRQLGVDAHWDVIRGGEKFFQFTKRMHNALHGRAETFGPEDFQIFEDTTQMNLDHLNLYGDIIFIHDPQPVGLIRKRTNDGKKWVWRCHIDFSDPQPDIWHFLRGFIEQYDATVFSAPAFSQLLSTRQVLISPSIDPLSDKNRELPAEQIEEIVAKFGLDSTRPIVTQISRFDYLKDPIGVIDAFHLVKEYVDCQLVLAGGGAGDDPEGELVLAKVRERAADDPDIHVILLPPGSDLEINAIQRASSVILQKSLREGFGLTVTEALWKAKPVVASAVGGILLQIAHGHSGLLSHTIEGTAYWVKQLLNAPEYARRLGENGREHVRHNFLVTRHLKDYLLLFLSLVYEGDIVYLY